MVGKGGKANKTRNESHCGFKAHWFVKEKTCGENGNHPPQAIERRVMQYSKLTQHICRCEAVGVED